MLGKKIINTGGVACTTDTTQILDAQLTQSTALYRFEDNANDTASGTGKFNKGGIFNGSSSKIALPAILPTSSTADSSVSFWFKYSGGQSGTGVLFSSYGGNSAQPGYHLNIEAAYTYGGVSYPDGSLYLTGYSMGTGSGVNGTTSYADGEWHHVVVTYDFSTGVLSCFVDNASSATLSISFTSRPSTIGPFSQSGDIGYQLHGGPHRYAKCSIDQFRIFNKDLSTSERTTLYNETTTTANTLQVLGDTSCVAAYTFEGNANDLDTATPKNGTATNVIYDYNGTASSTTYVAGKFGKAALFNTNSSIDISGDVISRSSNSSMTWSSWINFTNVHSSSFRALVGSNNGGGFTPGAFAINLYGSSNGISCSLERYYNNSQNYSTSYATVGLFSYSPNTWYHLALSYDSSSSEATVYINGSKIGSSYSLNYTNSSYTSYSALAIGRYATANTGYGFDGMMDQIRIFDKALSPGEINSLYNETTTTAALGTISNPSTVAYYKMQDATDETGSYNGTASNVNFNVQGKYGFAGKFNGSSSFIETSSEATTTEGNKTISGWIFSNVANNGFAFVANGKIILQYTGNAFVVYKWVNGKTYYSGSVSAGEVKTITTSASYSLNTWYHVAIMQTGTGDYDFKLYINGTEPSTTQGSTAFGGYTASNFIIGSGAVYSGTRYNFWNGSIDQVRVFNKAISAAEVTKLYNEIQCADTITTPENYFNTVLYTGNATSRSITTTFQPDFVWLKNRGPSARNHRLFDSVRGATKGLYSDLANAEYTENSLTAFNTNGFTLGTAGNQNVSSEDYVSWNWKAGGILNQSASFNGSNGYIDTGLNQNVGNNFTWSLWFNSDISDSNYRLLIDKTNSSSPYPGAGIALQGGNVYGMINGTGTNLTYTGNSYSINQWYHVALTSNGSTVKLYLNSVEVGTGSVSTTNTSQNILIGDSITWTTNYDGLIDQVRIFNKEASPSEITTLYNETSSTINTLQVLGDTSCVAAYPLGTNANDLSTNYNANTASNITFNQPGHLNRNTNGTIESAVSASQESGFSIVKYTGNATSGATFGHGLNKKPDLILIKNLAHGGNYHWTVYSGPNGATGLLYLNLTDAFTSASSRFNNTEPTSSVVTLGNDGTVNDSGDDHIAYCFANVDGYQRIGSFIGNGSNNGPFIYTGFEPAWVIIKNTNTAYRWYMLDNKRNPTNPRGSRLFANDSTAEVTNSDVVDFHTNGFSITTSDAEANKSGDKILFWAIAANPDTTAPTEANSFKTKLYTGNNSTQSITGVGFKPDFVWFKNRTGTNAHALVDSVRGRASTIFSDLTHAATSSGTSNDLVSFDSDGFTVGSVSNAGSTNTNSGSIVSWLWKGLDHDRNLSAINTDGSIPSIVSANPAAGFSIVNWSATTTGSDIIGHGLLAKPQIIIMKNASSSSTNWFVYSDIFDGSYDFLYLNTTAAKANSSRNVPTATVFDQGNLGGVSAGNNCITYCFHSVAGYSKIGTYTGSSSTNTINVGFAPSFLMIKRTDSTGSWRIYDRERDSGNLPQRIDHNLAADSNGAEYDATSGSTGYAWFSSTGFYFDTNQTNSHINANGGTYIYMTFK